MLSKPRKCLALTALSTTLIGAPVAIAQDFINVLTGGTSGVYYPLGVALSEIYADGIEGSRTQVQATKASVENLNLLAKGSGQNCKRVLQVTVEDISKQSVVTAGRSCTAFRHTKPLAARVIHGPREVARWTPPSPAFGRRAASASQKYTNLGAAQPNSHQSGVHRLLP